MRAFKLFFYAAFLNAMDLDVHQIVSRSVAVNQADFQAFPFYSHRETDVEMKMDASGRPVSKSWKTMEILIVDGSPFKKMIARDGRPLSPDEQRKEDQRLGQETARRKAEPHSMRAARVLKFQKSLDREQRLMNQIAEAFDFRPAGEEIINGRAAYILDGEPNPDFHPNGLDANVLTGMHGRIWIDKADFHWARVRAEVTKPVSYAGFVAKIGVGTKFEFALAQVEENIWLPNLFIQDLNAKVLGVKAIRTRAEETYTNYHRADQVMASR